MQDTGWTRCEGLWERLRWARLNAAAPMEPKDAAAVIGVKDGTYRAYERPPGASKTITIDPQNVIKLGRRWKISWQWIVSGEGTPFDKELSPTQLRLLTLLNEASPEDQERAVRAIEGFLAHGKVA